ncbi:unnamed protein product, partial [Coccothraustes coccothraustes]
MPALLWGHRTSAATATVCPPPLLPSQPPLHRPQEEPSAGTRLCGGRKSLLALPLIACVCTSPRGLDEQRTILAGGDQPNFLVKLTQHME